MDIPEGTVVLDCSLSESYYKVPEFDTMMFLPAHLQEMPYDQNNEEEKDNQDEELDELPVGEDLEEDPFYQQEHKKEDFDDIENIFKKTCEKQGLDINDVNLEIDNSFHDTVINSVLNKFNNQNSIPEISGFLKKKSGTVKIWQKRYFVCRGNELCYFKSPKDSVLRGCINFDVCNVTMIDKKNKKTFGLKMKGLKREIQLKAETVVQAESWKAIIKQQIEKSEGRKNNKSLHIKKWWKMTAADFDIFIKTANSGDLLIYHMSKEMIQKDDHPDDCYHYALIVKHSMTENGFKVFFYD